MAQFADILIYKNLLMVPKSYNGRVVPDEIYSFTPSKAFKILFLVGHVAF